MYSFSLSEESSLSNAVILNLTDKIKPISRYLLKETKNTKSPSFIERPKVGILERKNEKKKRNCLFMGIFLQLSSCYWKMILIYHYNKYSIINDDACCKLSNPPPTAAAEMNENADGRHEGKEGHTSQSISKPQMSPPHHL